MHAARVVMGSIVVRAPARQSVSGLSKDVLHDLYIRHECHGWFGNLRANPGNLRVLTTQDQHADRGAGY
jgi:hypothetical protein